jgi:muramoyltetrapeptide carboxypeptidase LdcA involved in peptidoglycan recycling
VAVETVQWYNPDAVGLVGVPFGHTRPQWILPYGGLVTVDGIAQKLWADYS